MLISNFADRLNEALNLRHLTSAEVVRRSEALFDEGKIFKPLTKPQMTNYLKGSYEAKQDNIYALSLILDVDEAWLMGCDVPIERHSSQKEDDILKKMGAIPLSDLNKDTVKIPILGVVKAGYDYLAEENWQGTVDIKQELAKTGDFFALRIKGDSMFETLWNGDIVAVKKQNFAENGNIAVVLINGDEATVKQIKILDNGIKLMPLNRRINPETNEPYYEDMFFTKEEIEAKPVEIIGIVKQIVERNFF